MIPIMHLHRNEKYWPNPLIFDPDRFLPEKKTDSSNYYIPFSDGRRNCIGKHKFVITFVIKFYNKIDLYIINKIAGAKYALMSMKVILATLIRTFEFKTNKKLEIDEIKLKLNIVIEPKSPIKIKIEKRNLQ